MLGVEAGKQLKEITAPYFLRREKSTVLGQIDSKNESKQKISQKNDFIVWVINTGTRRIFLAKLIQP